MHKTVSRKTANMNVMHGVGNFKLVLAQKIKCVNNYGNTKRNLLKVNVSIWYNKQCQIYHVTLKYAQIYLKEL
jgi:hypothetical protein